ncbi:UbiA family prenyltransferase [Paenacidovorax monticola]|uniref:UbiA prenyltransferase family protein n=1 Tax=Paenacidovorax monticola TaxID=1926868 RepID=A0A7H0HHL1_9BURK|nr:UbiA family prenyltransferase [Paenacidovorax monticola]QNP60027.1 UbiA prenyltransferase family protein [Paenacidovorax monticola]
MLGAIFAASYCYSVGHSAMALLLLVIGNVLLVAHVFLLNDWAGVHQDLRDPARTAGVFLHRGVRRSEIGWLLLLLLAASLAIFSQLGRMTLLVALMIAAASALYSAPPAHWKGVPLANSFLHLLGGVLHFLLGYSIFQEVDAKGMEIGLFFAVVFSAGHLVQEVRDHEADLRNGIRTNAVMFGKRRIFATSFLLFTLANALLLVLALTGSVPEALSLVVGLYPLHLYWTLQTWREALTGESVRRLQMRYRWLYAGIGAAMVASVLWA